MPDILLTTEQQRLLSEKLTETFLSIGQLQTWLQNNFLTALAQLTGGNLGNEIANLLIWANSEDGMRTLLQKLADHPPNSNLNLPPIIYGLTNGKIRAQAVGGDDLPVEPPHMRWLAADHPFVNRNDLRNHLAGLDNSPPGAQRILIIDGEDRSGKTLGVCFAFGCRPASDLPIIDLDDFARVPTMVDARELATQIVGDDSGCPSYDPTKENEAVPRLILWLTRKLAQKHLWIIIDHCNRKAVTEGARSLLKQLAERIRTGQLPTISLILVDFDRNELPPEWRNDVRHDRAALPDEKRVNEWFTQLATAGRRKYTKEDAEQWVNEVFTPLENLSFDDGSWHGELKRQLQYAIKRIMACEVLP
jgi:hypothetical protein